MDVARVLRIVNRARPWVPVILEQTTDEAIARTVKRYGDL